MHNVAVFLQNNGYIGEKYFAKKKWIVLNLSDNTRASIM
jgi:hypothetical protein